LINTNPKIRLWHDQAIWKPGLAEHGDGVDKEAGNIGEFARGQSVLNNQICK